MKYSFLFFPSSHMSKKHTILVFFQCERFMMTFIMSVLDENSSIITIIINILLLTPIRRWFMILEILHVDLFFQKTLHFHFHHLEWIVKRDVECTFSHFSLHRFKKFPKSMESLNHDRIMLVKMSDKMFKCFMFSRYCQRLTLKVSTSLATSYNSLSWLLFCSYLTISVSLEHFFLARLVHWKKILPNHEKLVTIFKLMQLMPFHYQLPAILNLIFIDLPRV